MHSWQPSNINISVDYSQQQLWWSYISTHGPLSGNIMHIILRVLWGTVSKKRCMQLDILAVHRKQVLQRWLQLRRGPSSSCSRCGIIFYKQGTWWNFELWGSQVWWKSIHNTHFNFFRSHCFPKILVCFLLLWQNNWSWILYFLKMDLFCPHFWRFKNMAPAYVWLWYGTSC